MHVGYSHANYENPLCTKAHHQAASAHIHKTPCVLPLLLRSHAEQISP